MERLTIMVGIGKMIVFDLEKGVGDSWTVVPYYN